MYNCSQIDTFKTPVRFEGAVKLHSSVTNCAFHNGHGYGMSIKGSANIFLQNNIWFNFVAIGVTINYSSNITLDNSVVMGTSERTTTEGGAEGIDKACGICICTLFGTMETCDDIKVTNNIAAGLFYAGFIVRGQNCGDGKVDTFRNNVAHSIGGEKMGHGAVIYPKPLGHRFTGQPECFEGSYFAAYKCYYQGVMSYFKTNEVRLHHMTMLDNRQGMTAGLGGGDYDHNKIVIDDNIVYGETEIPDCPEDKSFCFKYDKFGFMLTGGTEKGKGLHVTGSHTLPAHKVKSLAIWHTTQVMRRNHFIGFNKKTQQGMRLDIFELNKYAADYHPMAEFFDTKFTDVTHVSYIMDPPKEWANLMDCGDYPCTSPMNILFSFKNSKWEGDKPTWAKRDFQIIANNSGFAPYIENCEGDRQSNAYYCDADKMGILMFESQDFDNMDRSMQPIYVKRQGTGMENKLNAMMDHVWDGFYTGQKRLQRFPSIIQAERGSVYDLNFTGTPAQKMKFVLRSQDPRAGTTIRIAYPSAMSRAITVDGREIEYNQWDENINNYGEIKQKFCGENRYIGVKNILEFYITTDCDLQIMPRDAIQCNLRMEWTLEEFFSDGGTTAFIDRLTASLGIHASTIKVVSVYEGSLVVNYEITSNSNNADELKNI